MSFRLLRSRDEFSACESRLVCSGLTLLIELKGNLASRYVATLWSMTLDNGKPLRSKTSSDSLVTYDSPSDSRPGGHGHVCSRYSMCIGTVRSVSRGLMLFWPNVESMRHACLVSSGRASAQARGCHLLCSRTDPAWNDAVRAVQALFMQGFNELQHMDQMESFDSVTLAKPPLALGMQVPRVRLCLAGRLKTHPGGAFDTAGSPHAAVSGTLFDPMIQVREAVSILESVIPVYSSKFVICTPGRVTGSTPACPSESTIPQKSLRGGLIQSWNHYRRISSSASNCLRYGRFLLLSVAWPSLATHASRCQVQRMVQ